MVLDLVTRPSDDAIALRARPGDADGHSNQRPDLGARVLEVLTRAREPLSRSALRERLRVNNKRLGDALAELAGANLVTHPGAGWSPVCVEMSPGETEAGSAEVHPAKG